MSDEVRSFYISGEAATAIGKKKGRKKKGGLALPNPPVTFSSNPNNTNLTDATPLPNSTNPINATKLNVVNPTKKNINYTTGGIQTYSQLEQVKQSGGHVPVMIGGKIKVELKQKTHRKQVVLQPKRDKKEIKKHRKSRKISFGLSSFHKRLTRAKKANKKIKEMSLDQLKMYLIEKKLIKPNSKAPESVLRQIAGDMQIVDQKAL